MWPKERRETGEHDLFRSRLDHIIDLDHALVKLAKAIDWGFLEEKFGAAYSDKPGHPPLPPRLMAGLAILKHSYDLSDEALCDRWVENPYFQYFCGADARRQRMGEDKLLALREKSLATAARTGGPQLSRPFKRRRHQRSPRHRSLQLLPPHRLAVAFAAPNPARLQTRRSAQISLKSAFFTDD